VEVGGDAEHMPIPVLLDEGDQVENQGWGPRYSRRSVAVPIWSGCGG
jgi:hypothetical protein